LVPWISASDLLLEPPLALELAPADELAGALELELELELDPQPATATAPQTARPITAAEILRCITPPSSAAAGGVV
jgi:hypothetical protein